MLTHPSPSLATDLKPTVILTPEQVAFYHREGYLALPSITSEPELEWMRQVYDALFQRKAGRAVGMQFDLGGTDEEGKEAVLPQILNPSLYAPELNQGLFRVNAEAIATQLLGPAVQSKGDHAIFKPARTGPETPCHQDEAYWAEDYDHTAFSLWMPLQPATMENGCMQFVPRSHQWEVIPHQSIGNDPRIHGLESLEKPASDTVVACPLPAGGCTIHHNRTMHYTGANSSEMPRRALILMFGLPAVKRSTPRVFQWMRDKQTARQLRSETAQEPTKV